MSGWRRLYARPAGSLPGGIVTQWGIGIITIGVLIVMTFYIYLGDGGEEEPFAAGQAPGENVAGSFETQVAAQVEQEQQRADARRDAAERELLSQQQGNLRAGQVSPNTAAAMAQAGNSPDTGEPYTEQEWELRERLRLEALERRSRSLRSLPVAQTYRQNDGGAFPTAAAPQTGAADDPLAAIRAEGAEALSNAMSTIQGVTANLEDDIAAEAEAGEAFIAALRGEAPPADPLATVAPVAARTCLLSRCSAITPTRPGSERRKTPPAGNESMRDRFWKPRSLRSFPATSPVRCWLSFPCRSTRRTGSGCWCREDRG